MDVTGICNLIKVLQTYYLHHRMSALTPAQLLGASTNNTHHYNVWMCVFVFSIFGNKKEKTNHYNSQFIMRT